VEKQAARAGVEPGHRRAERLAAGSDHGSEYGGGHGSEHGADVNENGYDSRFRSLIELHRVGASRLVFIHLSVCLST
jgi:hypothetical protein